MLMELKGTPATCNPRQVMELASNELQSRPIVPLADLRPDMSLDELLQQKRARDVHRMLLSAEMRILNTWTAVLEYADVVRRMGVAAQHLNQEMAPGLGIALTPEAIDDLVKNHGYTINRKELRPPENKKPDGE